MLPEVIYVHDPEVIIMLPLCEIHWILFFFVLQEGEEADDSDEVTSNMN